MNLDFKTFIEFFATLMADKVAEKLQVQKEEPQECKGEKINGIRGGAAYVGCSPSKMQDLKNKGVVPYYQVGKKIFFFSNELDNALKRR